VFQYPSVAFVIGAVPVIFALEMNPEEGKILLHFFLVVVDTVPLLYGAPVEAGIGMTVAVLKMTTGPVLEAGATSF
jgi:hypothetical protein